MQLSEARVRTQVPGALPLSPNSWSQGGMLEGAARKPVGLSQR